jgi:hypothetical protein
MACDRIERKVARTDYLTRERYSFNGERELVQHLLKLERDREALARRAQMRLVTHNR